jgi:RNA polymerase-binding transcription factor DksA
MDAAMKKQNPHNEASRTVQRRAQASTRAVLGKEAQPAQVNPKWAWHYRVLVSLRERLLAEHDEHLRQAATPLRTRRTHLADTGTDEFDHELALGLLSAEQNALYEVDAAIRRITDGTFGVCEETGKPISEERLRAVPWTRYSEAVEARRERKGTQARAVLGDLASVRTPAAARPAKIETAEAELPAPAPNDEGLRRVYSPSVRVPRPRQRATGNRGRRR